MAMRLSAFLLITKTRRRPECSFVHSRLVCCTPFVVLLHLVAIARLRQLVSAINSGCSPFLFSFFLASQARFWPALA